MESIAANALASVALVSSLPLLIASGLLGTKKADRFVFVAVSLSVGALFGDAFIHLIPESLEVMPPLAASLLILAGILFLFVLEKFMHWRHEHVHRHDAECAHAVLPVGPMSIMASGLHNFVDGAIIAASWLVSTEAGIATTIAVTLHEIPHEIGSVGILMHAGFPKSRAFLYVFYAGITAMFGAGMALISQSAGSGLLASLIPFAAGNFIYIAGSDLVPELHKTKHPGHSLVQFAAIMAGIGLMIALLKVG